MEQEQEYAATLEWMTSLRVELQNIPPQGFMALRKKYRHEIARNVGRLLDNTPLDHGFIPDGGVEEVIDAIQGTGEMTPEEWDDWRDKVLEWSCPRPWWGE